MDELSTATQSLLDDLELRAGQAFEEVSALPPALYTSGEIAALEQKNLFERDWLCPGLAAEIPEPGDYLTFSIGAQPIVVLRGKDGGVRSYSNICRHRMMRLLEGRGRVTRIVCPYHAWTYNLDGRLVGAGHMKQSAGFDPKSICLPEIRTEVWQGWIYVTLNPEASAVADLLAALLPTVERYDMAGYRPVIAQDHLWRTNWKILTENFMEGYHLPIAHRRTVGSWFESDSTRFAEQVHDAFTYQTFVKSEDAVYGRAHADNKRLEGVWRGTSVMPTVFPTHMYVLAPDHLWYLSLRPEGTGTVQVRFGVALAPEVLDDLARPENAIAEMERFFDRVNDEDRVVVEGIYANAGAPLAAPGRLSWMERSLHAFMKYLADGLLDRRERNSDYGAAAQ